MMMRRIDTRQWMGYGLFGLLGVLFVPIGGSALPAKLGDMDEDGVATIHDVVAILNHIHGRVPFVAERISFADLNRDGLVDRSDVDRVADAVVASMALADIDFNPSLTPTIPYTKLDRFTFTGTNFPMTRAKVSHAFGSTEVVSDAQGNFSLELPLSGDRVHEFYLAGYDASGAELPGLPLSVLQDSDPPRLGVKFPSDGFMTSASEIRVSGQLSDALSGQHGMAVTVDGVNAELFTGDGGNGSFLSGPVGLQVGANGIRVEGVDVAGNVSSQEITVNRVPTGSFRLQKSTGDGQAAVVGTILPTVISATVTGPGGVPLSGKPVVFEVVGGLGSVLPTSDVTESLKLSVVTDTTGTASVRWRMSTVAGRGNHLLRVRSRDIEGTVMFVGSALPNSTVRLNEVSGDGQVAAVGSVLTDALRVWVNDGGNALSGKPVKFQVLDGGGRVNGQETFTVNSGVAGFAEVQFRLGATVGTQRVAASIDGEPGASLVFSLGGVTRGLNASMSVRGLLLTPFLNPVANARVELVVEGVRFGPVSSDAAGAFEISGVSGGATELQVWLPSGITSQASPTLPVSTRKLLLPRGSSQHVLQPHILPMTENRTTVAYDGTQNVTLSLPGNASFLIHVSAGSIRTVSGEVPSAAAPIQLSLTQIPASSLPTRPPHGETPRIAWLIEPSDIVFTSAPQLLIPDLAGLAGDASVGVFGLDTRKHQFTRFASLEASGTPALFQDSLSPERIRAGFGFANAGYHGGRVTITSEATIPPASVE